MSAELTVFLSGEGYLSTLGQKSDEVLALLRNGAAVRNVETGDILLEQPFDDDCTLWMECVDGAWDMHWFQTTALWACEKVSHEAHLDRIESPDDWRDEPPGTQFRFLFDERDFELDHL